MNNQTVLLLPIDGEPTRTVMSYVPLVGDCVDVEGKRYVVTNRVFRRQERRGVPIEPHCWECLLYLGTR